MKRTPLKRTRIKPKAKRHINITPEVIAEVNRRADATVGVGKCERCRKYPDFRGLCYAEPKKQMGGTTATFEAKDVQRCCYPCHVTNDHHLTEVRSQPQWSKNKNQ